MMSAWRHYFNMLCNFSMPVAMATASLALALVPTQGFFFPTFWWIPEACCTPFDRGSLPHSRKNTKKNLRPPPTMGGGLNFGFLKLSKPLAPLKYKLELQNVYERNFLGYSYFTYNKKSDMLLSSRDIPEKGFYMAPLWATKCIDHTNECDWSSSVQTQTVSSFAKARCNQRDYN